MSGFPSEASVRKRRHKIKITQMNIPPSNDPLWKEESRAAYYKLASPQTTSAMIEWGVSAGYQQGVLINILAWLDLQGMIGYDRVSKQWMRMYAAGKRDKDAG